MSPGSAPWYEEIDLRPTPLGDLLLRRRRLPQDDTIVYEVLLDGAFLMSSLVNVSERALSRLALAEIDGDRLDVLVGGLGLGYTALEVLASPRLGSLRVVERLPEVIAWVRDGHLRHAASLATDPRCHLVADDFFERVRREDEGPYDAVLVDIDHSPRALLAPAHGAFYESAGLSALRERIRKAGIFALWSADAPDPAFLDRLETAFARARAEEVRFYNPLADAEELNTVYLAVA